MLGQAIAIAAGLGLIGVLVYLDQRAKPGGDWLFGALITAGLLLTVAVSIPAAVSRISQSEFAASDIEDVTAQLSR